jgi:hypothetical protein
MDSANIDMVETLVHGSVLQLADRKGSRRPAECFKPFGFAAHEESHRSDHSAWRQKSVQRFVAFLHLNLQLRAAALCLVFLSVPCALAGFSVTAADDRTQDSNQAAGSKLSAAPGLGAPDPTAQLLPQGPEKSGVKHPEVTYADGKLTIVAENVALSEVLVAVRQAMGADLEIPAGAAAEHVWVHAGPGPARRILRDLLDGTDFDYVIQASEIDEDGVRSVVLALRSKTPEVGVPGNLSARGANRSVPATVPSPEANTAPDLPAVEDKVASVDAAPVDPPPASAGTPALANNLQSSPTNVSPVAGVAASADAEQMAQQLQNMYQQRKQLQIQQTVKPPTAN